MATAVNREHRAGEALALKTIGGISVGMAKPDAMQAALLSLLSDERAANSFKVADRLAGFSAQIQRAVAMKFAG